MCGRARRLRADADATRVRAVRADAGRPCRAGLVPRTPVPGLSARATDDLAHERRRGLRTPGHNTNE